MEGSQLYKDAIANLKGSSLEGYSQKDDFEILARWTYIGMFLYEAKLSLDLLRKYDKEKFAEMEDVILYHGLFKNFILSYAKCFSSSGKGRTALNPNDIFKTQTDLLELHHKVMKIRNTYVAHNDESDFNISVVVTSETENEIKIAQTYTIMAPVNELNRFKELVEFCEYQVVIKVNKITDKIEGVIGRKIEFDQIESKNPST